jgi:raffinose/stachyose/melibiose transport system substrate-binding protein
VEVFSARVNYILFELKRRRIMTRKLYLILSIILVAAFALTACGTTATATVAPAAPATEAPAATQAPVATEAATAAPVTITWWHITTKDPGLTDWQKMADDYMAAHPNVKIEITVLENEAFKTKLATVLQSGEVPDIFQSWGGAGLVEQAQAGLLKDITPDLDADAAWKASFAQGALGAFNVDGKFYGTPWDMGMVSVWYNKDLFAKAGITATPTTWTEFLADVKTLKDAGITPLSIGEKDTWMGMHIWSYLFTRIGGQAGFNAVFTGTGKWTDATCVQAGTELKKLIDMKPFQEGFLGASHDESQGLFGNGEAAMLIGGQWTPAVESANSADKKGVANLGMFSFPAVEGGAGEGTDAMGGGNGFAIGKNASPEAIDFVKYLTSLDNQKVLAADGSAIPVVAGASDSIKDPNMKLVQAGFASAKYFQLYYDQFLPSSVAGAINDETAKLYAGTATPEEVCAAIQAAADAQ